MDQTNADLLLECSQKIIGLLRGSEEIAKLLLNDPQATATDLKDDSGITRYIFDYDYVDESTQEVANLYLRGSNASAGANRQRPEYRSRCTGCLP